MGGIQTLSFVMSEKKKYDNPIIGWVDEKENGNFKLSLTSNHLDDMKAQYLSEKGYVHLNIFKSREGKWLMSVYDPNAEGNKNWAANKGKTPVDIEAKSDDDLPF